MAKTVVSTVNFAVEEGASGRIRNLPVLLALHQVQRTVCDLEYVFEAWAVIRADGQPEADGKMRLFGVILNRVSDAVRKVSCSVRSCFRQNRCKLISAVTRWDI